MAAVVVAGCGTGPASLAGSVRPPAAGGAVQQVVSEMLTEVDRLLGAGGPAPTLELSGTDPAIAGTGLAAVAISSGPGRSRLVIDPEVVEGASADAVDVLIAHELVHARLQAATNPATPLWAVEGFADLVAMVAAGVDDRSLRDAAEAGGLPSEPPSDSAFGDTGPTRDAAYAQAYLLWWVIADFAGIQGAYGIYAAVAEDGDQAEFEVALHLATGLSRQQLNEAWRAQMEPSS